MSTLPLIVPHLLLRCVLIWMKSYMASLLLCHKKPVMNWPCLMLQTHLLYLLSLSPPSDNPTKPNFLLLPNNNKSTKDHLEQKHKDHLPQCSLSMDHPTNLSRFYEILTSFLRRSFPAMSPWNLLSIPLVSGDVPNSLSLCPVYVPYLSHGMCIDSMYLCTGMSLQDMAKFLKSEKFFFVP